MDQLAYVILAWNNHEATGVPVVYGPFDSFMTAAGLELQISSELTVIQAITPVKYDTPKIKYQRAICDECTQIIYVPIEDLSVKNYCLPCAWRRLGEIGV